MDPLIIHHVIRHRLSRIETNNFQDKSGCSINGFRSFLFEEGIVQNLDDMERLIYYLGAIQDYRGFPIQSEIRYFENFPLSDEILKMKNVQFFFGNQSKPIHKLVSPEPHFIEEERNLIENHFSYLESDYNTDDIEDWKCFQMDSEGHLVSLRSDFNSNFQLSNESIEHLSNFPHLKKLYMDVRYGEESIKEENVTNFSLLSNLVNLTMSCNQALLDYEFFKDLGLFTNLLYLEIRGCYSFENYQFDNFPFSNIYIYFLLVHTILPPSFSNLSNLAYLRLSGIAFQGFGLKKNSLFILFNHFIFKNRRGIFILFPKYDKIDKSYSG